MNAATRIRVKVPRPDITPAEETAVEAGQLSSIRYGSTDILTAHGLQLIASDLGMEPALELLCKNADGNGWPTVVETPPELYEHTDCAGLVIRPHFFDLERCVWWSEREGANLIRYFGNGARFAFMPALLAVPYYVEVYR